MSSSDSLHIEQKNDRIWITLPGTIRRENTTQLTDRIMSSLSGSNDQVVLDFTYLLDIYSITINFILHLRELVVTSGGNIYLINVTERCRKQMNAVHLEKILDFIASEDELPPLINQ